MADNIRTVPLRLRPSEHRTILFIGDMLMAVAAVFAAIETWGLYLVSAKVAELVGKLQILVEIAVCHELGFLESLRQCRNLGTGPGLHGLQSLVDLTPDIEHRVLLPPNRNGTIQSITEDSFSIDEEIGKVDEKPITLMHQCPVRQPRPFKQKLMPDIPLLTGQRIFDTLFPIAKGGTACIPGGFGTGKTVMQHQLAKWSDADIVVYIGCGERGNEMTEVLTEFPALKNPKTGAPLMERTVLIANTSNMPVAAREASVYTGITIAEYYRDMGYGISLMADSSSRWAEAMREISSKLEKMPGEEGYPAYLATKLAAFYERSGRVKTLNEKEGSITVIGAVSPPGFPSVHRTTRRLAPGS